MWIRTLLLPLLTCAALSGPATAERRLVPSDVMTAEMLPGWRTASGTQMAALHLRLDEDWKTYWRSPGEAGVPPVFDWSGSENLASVAYHWPAPKVFEVNGLRTIGYSRELVLPIEFTPQDPSRPLQVAAEVELGLCRDICVPMSLRVTATLMPTNAKDARIEAALANGPRGAVAAGLTGLRCRIEPISDGLRVEAAMEMPTLGGKEVAVFETPDPSVWIGESSTRREGRKLTTTSELVPQPGRAFALDRSALRLTVVGQNGAVEVTGCPAG